MWAFGLMMNLKSRILRPGDCKQGQGLKSKRACSVFVPVIIPELSFQCSVYPCYSCNLGVKKLVKPPFRGLLCVPLRKVRMSWALRKD